MKNLLLNNWHISNIYDYIWQAFLFSILIWCLGSWLKTISDKFNSDDNSNEKSNNYLLGSLLPFILGTIELFCYPILMYTDNWIFIGAWLSFKTIAQWSAWSKDRNLFNRYLIMNSLVLIVSFLFLVPLIDIKK